MAGEVTRLELPDVTLHVFTAPPENYMVNSLVFELAEELLVVDAQMFVPDASDFADLVESLGKPVRQFVLSHNHPDHFAGYEVLCNRFPDVELAALPGVTEYVAELGPQVIAARRAEMGSRVASRAIVPTGKLPVGEQAIGGVRFVFEGFDDAEAESQVVIHLPDHGTTAVFDLACRAEHHVFTVRPAFDRWTEVLRHLQSVAGDDDRLVVGHGPPTDPGALEATIEYLRTAKDVYAEAAGAEEYAAELKSRFPERGETKWIDLSALLLYRVIYP